MVGKGYEVSVFDVAPNVPDGQVEREKIPVESLHFRSGSVSCRLNKACGCQLLLISCSSTAPMAAPDASTVIAVTADGTTSLLLPTPLRYSRRKLKLFLPRLALWDYRPIEIAFLGSGGHIAMVRVGHSDEL
ncbi:hypothetical protein T05_7295 [Trichinella murrelli]|uniref:Uncharacterized protein n=1 Tax=Trichinella murrelli TaxID=144512 RepID=A0A0V0T5B6_9BILA|nr:hypothetical protein T05_12295 [Trichinella murrelli]KRX34253.1 hypothetical protein T05_6326 [Trichinella murrelli]KRX34349.1 hypothetical protein T05_2583 [Trichinella murrelli]KRX34712.1 hypothetical protein T05_15142 [Trichinella murrelli]KRX35635.1 hypothetical protein T05_7295 [Trichinella murrelli]